MWFCGVLGVIWASHDNHEGQQDDALPQVAHRVPREIFVSPIPSPLTQDQIEELRISVDPLKDEDSFGVDTYKEVLRFIVSKLPQ
mgnify:CR=1 FL=1